MKLTTIFCVIDDFCKEYYNVHIRFFLKDCFCGLVSYNRFVELAQKNALSLFVFASAFTAQEDNIYFIDSFPLKACHNRRIYSHKALQGIAARGKSSMGWFFGTKLHLIINTQVVTFDFYEKLLPKPLVLRSP